MNARHTTLLDWGRNGKKKKSREWLCVHKLLCNLMKSLRNWKTRFIYEKVVKEPYLSASHIYSTIREFF